MGHPAGLRVLLGVVLLVLLAAGPSTASPTRRAADEEDDYAYDEDGDEYSSSGEEDEEQEEEAEEKDADDALRRGRRVQHKHLDLADKLAVGLESQPPQDEESCPPAPPRRPSQCWAPRCASDGECAAATPGQPRRRCCFNGCVGTCLRAADPPPVVDWEEETPDALHPDGRRDAPSAPLVPAAAAVVPATRYAPPPRPAGTPRYAPPAAHPAPPEAVMAGCTLRELGRLQDLRSSGRGSHARKCFCSDGAILCRVSVH